MSRKHPIQALAAVSFASAGDAASAPRSIRNVRLMDEPAWSAALAGDPAAAIGSALRAATDPRCGDKRRQLTITALEVCATAGDPAARAVLAHLTRRIP